MTERKYSFFWGLLGDIEIARPNLGPMVRLETYRLMQCCFRDVLELSYGTKEADRIFYESGFLAGKHFYTNLAKDKIQTFEEFINFLQNSLRNLGIGILKVESSNHDTLECVLTISEDVDCSGLPDLNYETCIYDEGFLTGIFEEAYKGITFKVKEIDCWCTNDRTCRFTVTPLTKT